MANISVFSVHDVPCFRQTTGRAAVNLAYRGISSTQISEVCYRTSYRSLGRAAFAGLHCFLSLAVAGALAAGQDTTSVSANLPRIATHNNTVPAGVFRNGVLNLNLEIVKGEWYPEAEDGPHCAVYAFAAAGQATAS